MILSELIATHTTTEKIGNNHWLLIKVVDNFHISGGLYQFHSSDINAEEGDYEVQCIFKFDGPSGSLRECRHIWWNPEETGMEGYTYYLNFDAVSEAFTQLKTYFDGH